MREIAFTKSFDKVKIKHPETGLIGTRILDVGNPWLDAGIVPYSTLNYNDDKKYWEKWFPGDFIVESFPGQFRNWFYSLLALSTVMEDKAPFKTLLGHALVKEEICISRGVMLYGLMMQQKRLV